MSRWRSRVLRFLPEKRFEIQHRNFTVDAAFRLILPRFLEAHRRGESGMLSVIYGFAEWCWRGNNAPQLRNAVGTLFYPHLADDELTRREMHLWLKPAIFRGISEMLQPRMSAEEFQAIETRFREVENRVKDAAV